MISRNFAIVDFPEPGVPEIEIIRSSKEGYIFPDTYMFPKNATMDVVLSIIKNKILINFYCAASGVASGVSSLS